MSETDNRLGTLLIKNKLINYQQLTQALEFQAKLNNKNKMPIGEILIQFGFITHSSLVDILSQQKNIRKEIEDKNQLEIDQESKVSKNQLEIDQENKVSKNQLFTFKPSFNKINSDDNKAKTPSPPMQMDVSPASKTGPRISNNMYSDRSRHKPIGEIIVEKEYITRAQLSHALEYQATLPPVNYKPIGEVLIDLNYISREQLNTVLGVQPPVNSNALGEILKQLGIIDAYQLSLVLSQQYSIGGKAVMIGELLLQHGFITKAQLDLALEEQKNRKQDI